MPAELQKKFSNVSPEESVLPLAQEIAEWVAKIWMTLPLSAHYKNVTTILVQGEMRLVVALVRLLKNDGKEYFKIVAATTKREVIETINTDGTTSKNATFKFVRFAEYE